MKFLLYSDKYFRNKSPQQTSQFDIFIFFLKKYNFEECQIRKCYNWLRSMQKSPNCIHLINVDEIVSNF